MLQEKEFTLTRCSNAAVRDIGLQLKLIKLLNKISPSQQIGIREVLDLTTKSHKERKNYTTIYTFIKNLQ